MADDLGEDAPLFMQEGVTWHWCRHDDTLNVYGGMIVRRCRWCPALTVSLNEAEPAPLPPWVRAGAGPIAVAAPSGSSSTSREEGVGLSPSDEERASEGSSDLTSVPPPPDPQQAAESGSTQPPSA